jgi:hypothetical protein
MKKEDLIKQLETIKTLSSQVDIDKMIGLLNQLEIGTTRMTRELADELSGRIERTLDMDSDEFVELDSAEFELSYDNRIELSRVDVNVYNIMEHVNSCIEEYVDEVEEEDLQVEAYNENFGSDQDEETAE